MKDSYAENSPMQVRLSVVVISIIDRNPAVLCLENKNENFPTRLPSGHFNPALHITLETGLKNWIEEQTEKAIGYFEQIRTFVDPLQTQALTAPPAHLITIGYLAFADPNVNDFAVHTTTAAAWKNWYEFFPWEDWRDGRPAILDDEILPLLKEWANAGGGVTSGKQGTLLKIRRAFGDQDNFWSETKAHQRFELIHESGILSGDSSKPQFGLEMGRNERRTLAVVISRLREKLRYQPVIKALMPEEFTLTQLQQSVELIRGKRIHKQNFRRQINQLNLVEPTGISMKIDRGRPAALFRFS